MAKVMKSQIKDEVLEYLNSEEGAKMIYAMGVVLAQGAKSGFGMTGKTGKFKFTDLIASAAGEWLGKLFGGKKEEQGETPALSEKKLP